MAKRPNQRLKLLYLAKIMLRLTDDEHGLQVEQMDTLRSWGYSMIICLTNLIWAQI